MWLVILFMCISFLIPMLMIILSNEATVVNYKMLSVFECGFDSYNVSVLPLSLRFFIFCIIFLILDLELIIVSFSSFVQFNYGLLVGLLGFVLLLTLGLVYDWAVGGLNWLE